jgi:Ni,Fe-hydrogenase III small subunit/NAD-dependent dihydropyrimidine dehydrogenase PreA subunit
MNPLFALLTAGSATAPGLCPELTEEAAGLPAIGDTPCAGDECRACADACPTEAIQVDVDAVGGVITLDRGRCIGCGECLRVCPTGTLVADRSTRTAVRRREELVLTNRPAEMVLGVGRLVLGKTDLTNPTDPAQHRTPNTEHPTPNTQHPPLPNPFRRSLHVRVIATGCSATDQEVAATTNPVFDVARFGIHVVASPRFADALIVTGPVARAMQEPLRRCYEAMAEPRLVIAVGTCAISGGLFRESYAAPRGVDAVLPVDVYVPGCPPHPWSIIHGLLLAMGRDPAHR